MWAVTVMGRVINSVKFENGSHSYGDGDVTGKGKEVFAIEEFTGGH